ncbi:hypothetical protein SynRS9909_02486 [Synechococcus sp. RS9909]|nr:hypothetical protein SynRS9909_02486 [Synechococcus sp. RS9909]
MVSRLAPVLVSGFADLVMDLLAGGRLDRWPGAWMAPLVTASDGHCVQHSAGYYPCIPLYTPE